MPRVVLVAALSWAALACGTSGTSGGAPGEPEAEAPEPPSTPAPCGDLETRGALAVFDGRPCPWVLRPMGDARVELVHATTAASTRAGEVPPPCTSLPCTFRGIETPLGPLVVVEVAGAGSEVPSGVWLGWIRGDSLSFVDLWDDAGDPVMDDGIEIGPAHALAPHDCEGTLALFATPRVPGAATVPAPASLLGREGTLDASGGEVQRERCDPLRIGLP